MQITDVVGLLAIQLNITQVATATKAIILGLKIKETDIANVHRSGKKKTSKTRDIIVQFEITQCRESFYGAKQNSVH